MRHRTRGHAAAADDLNLIPYLDIVVNLVMFLLLASDFAAPLTEIRFGAPPVGVPGEGQDLGITVAITSQGYEIFGAAPWAGSIPRRDGDLDVDALTAHLASAKRASAEGERPALTISAEDDMDLGRVVATIDAVRADPEGGDLFPVFRFARLTL